MQEDLTLRVHVLDDDHVGHREDRQPYINKVHKNTLPHQHQLVGYGTIIDTKHVVQLQSVTAYLLTVPEQLTHRLIYLTTQSYIVSDLDRLLELRTLLLIVEYKFVITHYI